MSAHGPPSLTLKLVLCIAGLLALVMTLAYRWGGQLAWQVEVGQLDRQLALYAESLQQRIDRYRTLPQVLALDPELLAALSTPIDEAARQGLNRRLEDANKVTRASTLTLVNAAGIAVAASNWRTPASNVGGDYSFRPYVQQGLREGSGRFYGIGMTTGEPGYFLSQAIRDGAGLIVGLVVIKIDLDALETEWLSPSDIVLVSDAQDVIFLASRPDWRYRTLKPLSALEREQLAATQQYAGQPLRPIEAKELSPRGTGARQFRVAVPEVSAPVLWQSLALPDVDWHLHLLHDTGGIESAARNAALAAGGGVLAVSFLVLFVLQRRRTAALKERSRAELESMLRQHAQELRTAQDGIVEAAKRADTGLSRSLEHLPQGVVIVDAQLRLTAWNSRYQELFRFPPELLRVGQPIQDLFRYNALRGLLGPGPVEEAIERRMQHLRSGRPHQRESEKEDGTVLEIRGNPLPEGGFVTSYADITSYRNAARELRSLADALELRVADRTRALDAAKQEAEVANRHKSRFVAAAVHDLLQPLNAGRMFVAALRSHVSTEEGRAIAHRIEQSLAAQDAILGSLLDIARLESGRLAVHRRDFPLAQLLDAVASEAAIVAQARGLALRIVPTRAVVRSDVDLLRRVLQNFVANAIRYTDQGRVLLGCRRRGDHLRIEVHDQGPGIPESQQQAIFEEFRRLDNGGNGDRGAGLGLAIVERIGRLLEHPIGLRSSLGRGSVFWVQVPLGTPALAKGASETQVGDWSLPADPALSACQVWCVDDDPAACDEISSLLRRWGCAVAYAGGVEAALAAAERLPAPQVLLLKVPSDSTVPASWEELQARWQRAGAAQASLILMAADRDPALRKTADAQGWGLLGVPVRASALRSLIAQLLVRRAG